MNITRIKLERFTAFDEIDLVLSPGINVFVGANGTGKTHVMKVAYAACDITKSQLHFADKLIRAFLPSGRALGRLVKRQQGSSRSSVEVWRGDLRLQVSFSNHASSPDSAKVEGGKGWTAKPISSVYVPVKEMLANAPGFRSLYAQREIHFDEVYADVLDRAYLPALRGPVDRPRKRLLNILQKAIDGKVMVKNEEFFLSNRQGHLEFSLLAEGMRKLGLLWLLIQNGTLLNGAVLFWDEPETNLNPSLFGTLVDILLELSRHGVQVFLATHDYVILKELDLRRKKRDNVAFHALFRDLNDRGEIRHRTTDNYLGIHPNAIAQAFADLYDRDVQRSLGGQPE